MSESNARSEQPRRHRPPKPVPGAENIARPAACERDHPHDSTFEDMVTFCNAAIDRFDREVAEGQALFTELAYNALEDIRAFLNARNLRSEGDDQS